MFLPSNIHFYLFMIVAKKLSIELKCRELKLYKEKFCLKSFFLYFTLIVNY